MFKRYDKGDVLAPRGAGKSYFWAGVVPLCTAERFPGCETNIFSSAQDQARKRLRTIRKQVEENPRLKHLLPGRTNSGMWGADAIQLANGSIIMTAGFGTKTRGDHPKLTIVDDPLGDEAMTSESVRNRATEFFFSAIANMPLEGSKLWGCGTPMHFADLHAQIEKTGVYQFHRYPALDAAGRPAFPELFGAAFLEAKRKEIGEIRFAREFLCQPRSDASSLFPEHLFQDRGGVLVQRYDACLGMAYERWRALGVVAVFVGVDFGLDTSVGRDFTVVFTVGVTATGEIWIMDIERRNKVDYIEQKNMVKRTARYRPDLVQVEAVQAQKLYGDMLVHETGLPIRRFYTGKGKHSDVQGVPGMRVSFENHKWRIPRGDAFSIEMTDMWMGEMQALTMQDGKVISVATHDDLPIASWIAYNGVREGASFGFSFGEQAGDAEAYARDEVEDAKALDAATDAEMAALEEDIFGVGPTGVKKGEDEGSGTNVQVIDIYGDRAEKKKPVDQAGAPPASYFVGSGSLH